MTKRKRMTVQQQIEAEAAAEQALKLEHASRFEAMRTVHARCHELLLQAESPADRHYRQYQDCWKELRTLQGRSA